MSENSRHIVRTTMPLLALGGYGTIIGRKQAAEGEMDGDNMIRTVEGVIGEDGTVRLLEVVPVTGERRALVTILDEQPAAYPDETAQLSEAGLAEDWNRPEESAAWAYLQSGM